MYNNLQKQRHFILASFFTNAECFVFKLEQNGAVIQIKTLLSKNLWPYYTGCLYQLLNLTLHTEIQNSLHLHTCHILLQQISM